MDTKSRIFFVVFFLLIAGAIGATYYRYFIVRDYIITAQASCDPFTEACFVSVCDPSTTECTGDPEQDTTYYALISRNAKHMPICNPSDEGCDALTCPPGEADCTVTLCTPDALTDGVVCNNPTNYTLLHPQDATPPDESSDDAMAGSNASSESGSDNPQEGN